MTGNDWKREHHEWRKKVNAEIPKLAAKIFSFRGKHYVGAGFHYSIEKTLGSLIQGINNFEEALTIDVTILLEILYDELKEKIAIIEVELCRK